MKRTRVLGLVLLVIDALATPRLVDATLIQGSDYIVDPGVPVVAMILGALIGLVALVLIIGPGSRVDPVEK